MTAAIEFRNVSKKFTLKHQRSNSFQESFVNFFRVTKMKVPDDLLPVLDDVSFTIEKGESVAFIGPNGTGKSTTLKVISGILSPDAGTVIVDGRVGALLELGAGFHPDLTGRENIYLNGAVLGLSSVEVSQRIDEIIAFSELKNFIDIQVKHYSSGMYMRLGFSIAVHTSPEILLVDEVLAVGDASFQRKCLDKIDQLRNQEKVTIVLVSHSIDTVRKICNRVIWMEGGEIIADGSAENILRRYLSHSYGQTPDKLIHGENHRWGSMGVCINQIRLLDAQNNECSVFETGSMLIIEIEYFASEKVEKPVFGVGIHRSDGYHIAGPNTKASDYKIPFVEGMGYIRYVIPNLPFLGGSYFISVAAHNWEDTEMFDYHDRLYPFKIVESVKHGYGLTETWGQWHIDTRNKA